MTVFCQYNWTRRGEEVRTGAHLSEVVFFFLWFNSINFCLSRVGIITDTEKAHDLNINIADANKPKTGRADLEKADRAEVDGIDKLGIGKADPLETDGGDKPGIGTAHPAEADRKDKPGTSTRSSQR